MYILLRQRGLDQRRSSEERVVLVDGKRNTLCTSAEIPALQTECSTHLLPRLQLPAVVDVVLPYANKCVLVVIADRYAALSACVELLQTVSRFSGLSCE
jgi:hypothetical protein